MYRYTYLASLMVFILKCPWITQGHSLRLCVKTLRKTPNMMMMHRDGNSVYYAGILQLDTQNYIGACLLMSGVIIYDVETMFRLFQWTFEELAKRGILLHYNSNKRIEALEHIDVLAEHPKDTQHAEEVILNMFST